MGEISLTGQVRPVPRLTHRLSEAARLGFTTAVVPRHRSSSSDTRIPADMNVIEVSTLAEALSALGLD